MSTVTEDSWAIKVQDGIIFWKMTTNKIELPEAQVMSDKIRQLIESGTVNKMFVDNSFTGALRSEVAEVWGQLMGYILESQKLARIATYTPSNTYKMQINRLSQQSNTFEFNRAFTDREAALMFLE